MAIVLSPVNLVVDFIFEDILSAPTATKEKLQDIKLRRQESVVGGASAAVRRASAITTQAIVGARRRMQTIIQVKQRLEIELPPTERQIPEDTTQAHALAHMSAQQLTDHLQEKQLKRHRSTIARRLRQSSSIQSCEEMRPAMDAVPASLSTVSIGIKSTDITERFNHLRNDILEHGKLLKPSARQQLLAKWG